MKKVLGALLVLLIGLYVVWPYWCLSRLDKAIRTEDKAEIARYVDFESVRIDLKRQAREKSREVLKGVVDFEPDSKMAALAETLMQSIVEKVVSPEGLILARETAEKLNPSIKPEYTWRFFSGLTTFRTETTTGIKAHLGLSGVTWKLKRIEFSKEFWSRYGDEVKSRLESNPFTKRLLELPAKLGFKDAAGQ